MVALAEEETGGFNFDSIAVTATDASMPNPDQRRFVARPFPSSSSPMLSLLPI